MQAPCSSQRPPYRHRKKQETPSNGQEEARQATRGERANDKKDTGIPELTVRAQDMNERMTQEVGNARWMRVMYRQIDLMKEKNAPLYYPVTPMNGQMNLFSIIFSLISEGKIDAYQYEDGYEDFSEGSKVNLKEMLDRFSIYYEEVAGRGTEGSTFVINESDIPSESVRSYYVKEAWYFDQNNSVFDVKTLAICPIMTSSGDVGEVTMPMFWIPYESIRPYINTAFIMTSNINNAMTFTLDDYFRRRMFEGDIIKTQNLMNQPLQAYCPTPDSMKREQDRIEGQLLPLKRLSGSNLTQPRWKTRKWLRRLRNRLADSKEPPPRRLSRKPKKRQLRQKLRKPRNHLRYVAYVAEDKRKLKDNTR